MSEKRRDNRNHIFREGEYQHSDGRYLFRYIDEDGKEKNVNTVAGYKTVINVLKKEAFGRQRIDKVRLSDAKAWLIKLQQVDGYIRFLCLDKNDMPMVALHWEKYLEHIVETYNKIYRIKMPKVTPHVSRHAFCSNMAKVMRISA